MERIEISSIQLIEQIYVRRGVVEVWKVRRKNITNEILCMKKIFVESIEDLQKKYQEGLTMASLSHENLAKIISVTLEGENDNVESVNLFMEYFPEGELENLIISRIVSKQY